MFFRVAFFLCVLGLLGIGVCAGSDGRTALVIGNAEYRFDPLENSVNDATDMASKLRKLGFDVILRHNLEQTQVLAEVDAFYQTLKRRRGVGLFYYAGHAIQIDGQNYLLPVDIEVQGDLNLRREMLPISKVTSSMKQAGCDTNIIILDACRTNPFNTSVASANGTLSRSSRGISLKSKEGLASVDAPAGTFVAYATAPDKVAQDGTGDNGVYTKHLLQFIDKPGLSIEKVFKETSKAVIRETRSTQVPWVNSSLTEDFYFNGKPEVTGGKRRVFGAF